jgi:hypothetical protein
VKLLAQREDLYKQLKINRDVIDKALTAFEADTICALESNFDKERGVILEHPIFEFKLTNSSDKFTAFTTSSIFSTS